MTTKKKNLLKEINIPKDLKYNWHEDPYSYYKLAKEIDLPYNLYELFSSNINDPQEEESSNKLFYKNLNTNNNNNSETKNVINKPKLCIPIIETILFENGQITGWIYNDKEGNVSKKPSKKLGTDNLIQYFLSKVKNYYVDGVKIFKYIPDSKILMDLPKYANYIVQKKNARDEKVFRNNNLEYIYEMEKIKFILIYYYSDKQPVLTDFINFYFLLNEHGGINSIKMVQNCLNCKIKNMSLSSSSQSFQNNESNINYEHLLRPITVKYSKPNELEQKKYNIFYLKPKIVQPMFNNNILNSVFSSKYFTNSTPTYNYPNSMNKYKTKYKTSKKIYINAEPKNSTKKYNNDIKAIDKENKKIMLESSNNSQEKNIFQKTKQNNFENYNLDDSMEKKFKYLLKGGKKNDGKILGHMENIEENLIAQNNNILSGVLSELAEKLIKYIEKSKNMIILYAYFIFVKFNIYELGDTDFYAFQKCLLIYGIDKNEAPVIEKTYLLKQNMKNIIYKRIPEDVNKFKNFEKFTKNDFCHGEFCNYIVPNFFKGIKEQQLPKNFKIPRENKISIRGKNNELPGKMPLFEIKKIYDNPELTNLVLKAYSIFPPSFNKESAIEKLMKVRNQKLLQNNEIQNNDNNNDDEETKKNAKNIGDEYGSIMDSTEKIAEKIQEYENEFKQEIIVYTPTPGKFLHVDYNDMYTEKGVCEKCYKVYTIILEFMKNIDECTAEFKSLIKAKQFLIKGENLKVSNFEDKNSNDNNLIIQEELGKMSVKKFLGIKILKMRMEELNKYKKKQKIRIERNLVTHKQELNKTFNYNLKINLRLLLANLLAEKTNNQFFSVLFSELYNEDDTVFKHLDIKKPKITFEKTNMKDLRLQMGISSLAYSPNFISNNKIKDKNNKNSFIQNMIKNNLEKQKNNEILRNIQQQICQIDKNLFQEYSYLLGLNEDNKESKDNISEENNSLFDGHEKKEKNSVMDEVFEYFRIPKLSRVRFLSGNKNKRNVIINNENSIIRNFSAKNKQVSYLLKKYKNKKMTVKQKYNSIKEPQKKNNIYNIIQIKSLEEIKKQKEKQLEEFLKFDPKKFHRKIINNNNNDNNNIFNNKNNISFESNNDSQTESKKSKNPLALLFEDDNWEYYDSQEMSSDSDAAKWDKDKVVVTSLFYNKTAKEFQDINYLPYYYITTPFPLLKDFNSTQRINENPLEILRKINFEQFSSLGNFFEDNGDDMNYEKNKYNFDLKNTKIYADDNFTAVPYEILDYNNLENEDKKIKKNTKNNLNNINNLSNCKNEDKKKYIVFVINDFFDTYVKYRYFFNLVLLRLRCYQNLSKNNDINDTNSKNSKMKDIKNNPLMIINSNNFKKTTHNLFIRKPVNILTTTKNNTNQSKEKEKNEDKGEDNENESILNFNTSSDKTDENNTNININNNIIIEEEKKDNSKEKNITKEEKISELKFVLFNLPGQSTTLFTKKVIQNNIFYSDFLDRFIYYLYKEKEFDLSYKIILLGFGNGGHIALTYASLYEKYWNILDSIIMFNSYCKNGPIINETMLEVLKLVTKENNPKTIEFFIKQSTHNPKEFNTKENGKNKKKVKNFYGFDDAYMELQKKVRKIDDLMEDKPKKNKSYNKSKYKIKKNEKNDYMYTSNKNNEKYENNDISNDMTLDGYRLITKGYFYNLKINFQEITTKILCIHSNVDSFINIHNISPLFDNDISSYHVTPMKELLNFSYKNDNINNKNNIKIIINRDFEKNKKLDINNQNKINTVMGYNLDAFKNKENNTRKLIIFDGSHDVSYSDNNKENIICSTLISYFN